MELTRIISYSLPLLFVVGFIVMMLIDDRAERNGASSSGAVRRLRRQGTDQRSGGRSHRHADRVKVSDLFPKTGKVLSKEL